MAVAHAVATRPRLVVAVVEGARRLLVDVVRGRVDGCEDDVRPLAARSHLDDDVLVDEAALVEPGREGVAGVAVVEVTDVDGRRALRPATLALAADELADVDAHTVERATAGLGDHQLDALDVEVARHDGAVLHGHRLALDARDLDVGHLEGLEVGAAVERHRAAAREERERDEDGREEPLEDGHCQRSPFDVPMAYALRYSGVERTQFGTMYITTKTQFCQLCLVAYISVILPYLAARMRRSRKAKPKPCSGGNGPIITFTPCLSSQRKPSNTR